MRVADLLLECYENTEEARQKPTDERPNCPGARTEKANGELAELAFVHKAASLGFGVAKPERANATSATDIVRGRGAATTGIIKLTRSTFWWPASLHWIFGT